MLGFTALGQVSLGSVADDSSAYIITIEAGSFTYSGQSAGLIATRRLVGDAGSFVLTGNSAVTKAARVGRFAVGSFVLSGQDARLAASRRLTASLIPNSENTQFGFDALGAAAFGQGAQDGQITFSVSGQSVGFRAARAIIAEVGQYTLSGFDASLVRFLGIRADVGAVSWTGNAARLAATRRMSAGAGSFGETGQVVDFVRRKKGLNIRPSGGASRLMASTGGAPNRLRVRA